MMLHVELVCQLIPGHGPLPILSLSLTGCDVLQTNQLRCKAGLAGFDQAARIQAAFRLLGVSQGLDRASLRAAYVQKMKLLHPDVNMEKDTTAEATAVVAAYKLILEVRGSISISWFFLHTLIPPYLLASKSGCLAWLLNKGH